jgi:glycosyltransferase involved in cell wall biosynthesis
MLPSKDAKGPLVSVVINNYNYERFVGDAIRSALEQSYPHLDVVVVDDGSTDGSCAIISSFHDVLPVFKENGGQASAYNAGFAVCRGEIVLFLDSDDLLDREAIAEVVRLFEPGVAKVHFYLRVVTGTDATWTEAVIPATQLADGNVRDHILRTGSYTAPPASGNAYARFALTEVFPIPETVWKIAADTYPVYLTALLGTVRRCDRVLGSYRVHGSNHEFEAPFNGRKLRYRLGYEANREEMLFNFLRARGDTYPSGSLERQFNHLKARFASLVIDATQHPFPADCMGTLAAKLIRAAWVDRGSRLNKKLLLSGWVIALLFASAKRRQHLVDVAFIPAIRSRALSLSIRPAHAQAL